LVSFILGLKAQVLFALSSHIVLCVKAIASVQRQSLGGRWDIFQHWGPIAKWENLY